MTAEGRLVPGSARDLEFRHRQRQAVLHEAVTLTMGYPEGVPLDEVTDTADSLLAWLRAEEDR